MNCTMVDFRYGRLPKNNKDFQFITVADSTGQMSIGMNMQDINLDSIGLSEDERSDDAFCFCAYRIDGYILVVSQQ